MFVNKHLMLRMWYRGELATLTFDSLALALTFLHRKFLSFFFFFLLFVFVFVCVFLISFFYTAASDIPSETKV